MKGIAMIQNRTLPLLAGLVAMLPGVQPLVAQSQKPIVEIATLKLGAGITRDEFQKVDKQMQATYMEKRPGFVSREALPGKDGTWVAIVHWRSLADADASMKSFASAAGTAKWMADIAPNSLVMNRYGW
jgi:hypothetical protein